MLSHRISRVLSLFAVALLAGIMWRAEVEWRGWSGVAWVRWFHWAVPLGALLFALWLLVFSGARRRWTLAWASLVLGAAAYETLHGGLMTLYSRWPQPIADVHLAFGLCLAAVTLYPLSVWACARRCGVGIRLGPGLIALGLWAAAVPLAIGILDLTGHIGGADFLHAIKSGVVIPPLLVALGLPFVWGSPGRERSAGVGGGVSDGPERGPSLLGGATGS